MRFVWSWFFISILASDVYAVDSEKLEAVAHFNNYARAGYNDCWGYTDADGREYALLGVRNGTSIIDITDTNNLREIAFFESARSTWKDIKTYQHYAYVVTDMSGWGMQILDLSGLPERVELVNTYKGFRISHNLSIDTNRGILYAQGGHSSPVRVLDLADPENPVQVAKFGVETHDIIFHENLVFVSEGGHGTIGIFDLTEPANPTLVSRFEIRNAGYVHNAWPTNDGQFLMTTEETAGKTVKMFALNDLFEVEMVDEYLAPNRLAHNAHIKGDYAYISHYGAGLRILDVSDPSDMIEVAHFTKSNYDDKRGFIDNWGAFPFFESGKVLVSDISDGLYVVEFAGARE